MSTLIESQLSDALALMKGISAALKSLPDEPEWGGGLRLWLPKVIPLTNDYSGDDTPVAWLVANDFDGYDLSTVEPTDS